MPGVIRLELRTVMACTRCGALLDSGHTAEDNVSVKLFGVADDHRPCYTCDALPERWDFDAARPMSRAERAILTCCKRVSIAAPERIILRRLRPGRHQRSAGAWSWVAESVSGWEVVAGYHRIRDLARAPAVEAYRPDLQMTPELLPKP